MGGGNTKNKLHVNIGCTPCFGILIEGCVYQIKEKQNKAGLKFDTVHNLGQTQILALLSPRQKIISKPSHMLCSSQIERKYIYPAVHQGN